MVVAHRFHLFGVGIKNAIIVCLAVFCKYFVQFFRGLVAVGGASLLCHFDASIGHKGALQRLVGLQTYHCLLVFRLWGDICWSIGGHTRHYFCFHVQYAPLATLLFLKLLQLSPQIIGVFCGSFKKLLVAVVGGVVVLNKISYVYL